MTGTLKGYDQLLNLVMDDLEETLNGAETLIVGSLVGCALMEFYPQTDPETGLPAVPPQTRALGLAVIRGTSLVLISPLDGLVSQPVPDRFRANNPLHLETVRLKSPTPSKPARSSHYLYHARSTYCGLSANISRRTSQGP